MFAVDGLNGGFVVFGVLLIVRFGFGLGLGGWVVLLCWLRRFWLCFDLVDVGVWVWVGVSFDVLVVFACGCDCVGVL